jgi:hypothetical protein
VDLRAVKIFFIILSLFKNYRKIVVQKSDVWSFTYRYSYAGNIIASRTITCGGGGGRVYEP